MRQGGGQGGGLGGGLEGDPDSGWDDLSDAQQLEVAHHALRAAMSAVAGQAEALANEILSGALPDRGGAEALWLLSRLLRLADEPVGLLPGTKVAGSA